MKDALQRPQQVSTTTWQRLAAEAYTLWHRGHDDALGTLLRQMADARWAQRPDIAELHATEAPHV